MTRADVAGLGGLLRWRLAVLQWECVRLRNEVVTSRWHMVRTRATIDERRLVGARRAASPPRLAGLAAASSRDEAFDLWGVTVAPGMRAVTRAGRTHLLTRSEWQLLAFLLEHAGRVVSRDEIARGAWGAGYSSRGCVEACISRLRRKIEQPDPHTVRILRTVRGSGYVLALPAAASPPVARESA